MFGTAILAKSMVIGELSESGQVGHVESNLQKVVIDPNKDYSDAPTAMDGQLIKVSDLSPKADEIIGGTISGVDYETGEKMEQTITSEFIDTENAVIKMFGNGYALIGSLLVFTEVNEGSGIETGVYAPMEYLEELPSLFTIVWGKETIHPINKKYIPDSVADDVINKLTKSGQVGHVEPGKVYTYDGNLENAEGVIFVDEIFYAQIATGEFDLNKVARVELVYNGQSVALTSADMQVTTDADGTQKLIATVAGITLPGIVCKDGKLFVFSMGEHHVKTVEFAETIHPIEPKFIPGAVLPVVELSTELVADGQLTEAEISAVKKAIATGMPIVVKAMFDGGAITAVGSNVMGEILAIDVLQAKFAIRPDGLIMELTADG